MLCLLFFFSSRRRHTRLQGDWSSDVCSSDLDPKMVELSMYNALPHLRHPVVTNNQQAATALKWAVREMERRYQLFHANHARNITDFNRKVRDGKPLKGQRETLATPAGIQRELPFDAEYTEGVLPSV